MTTQTLSYTPLAAIPKMVATARDFFNTGATKSLTYRKTQLSLLKKMLLEKKTQLLDALHADLKKPIEEALVTEFLLSMNEVDEALNNLEEWAKPYYPSKDLAFVLDTCLVRKEPKGVVLIIGAYNYPLLLTIQPIIGAIAAGNTVILKPSELTVHTSKVVSMFILEYLDKSLVQIVNGSIAETTKTLECQFDQIFYTGSGAVAKVVMAAAAKHLTPIILELGGKSPVIVDNDIDIQNTANRIIWGKFINCGQTCIAPDYVLCPKKLISPLSNAMKNSIQQFYGPNPRLSKDYPRIINERHLNRLKDLIKRQTEQGGKIIIGGEHDDQDLYLAPTIFTNVGSNGALMEGEIFGPILPIIEIGGVDEAVAYVNSREKPLVLYAFSKNKEISQRILDTTSSGGAIINDTLMHMAVSSLPFGGIGSSGMGNYHGKHTFDAFSHSRAVMIRSMGLEKINSLRYAPYSMKIINLMYTVLMKRPAGVMSRVIKFLKSTSWIWGWIAFFVLLSLTKF